MMESELVETRSSHGRPEILLMCRDQREWFEHVARKREIINITVLKIKDIELRGASSNICVGEREIHVRF
jgi:hypothetical protein